MDTITFELNGEKYNMTHGRIIKIEKRYNRDEWLKLKESCKDENSFEEAYKMMIDGNY